jgi:hypothetical protein
MRGLIGAAGLGRKCSKRVRVATACVQLFAWVVLIGVGTPEAHADAKLLHFDTPASERVPGQYYVLFKTEQELRQLPSLFADPRSGVKKPRVLPDNLPTTTQTSRALAEALAASVHGHVLPPYECPYEGRQGFWIKLPENMVMLLAKDPRIESLEPDAIVHLSSPHQTAPLRRGRPAPQLQR